MAPNVRPSKVALQKFSASAVQSSLIHSSAATNIDCGSNIRLPPPIWVFAVCGEARPNESGRAPQPQWWFDIQLVEQADRHDLALVDLVAVHRRLGQFAFVGPFVRLGVTLAAVGLDEV